MNYKNDYYDQDDEEIAFREAEEFYNKAIDAYNRAVDICNDETNDSYDGVDSYLRDCIRYAEDCLYYCKQLKGSDPFYDAAKDLIKDAERLQSDIKFEYEV